MSINPLSQLYSGGLGQQSYMPQGYPQQASQYIPPAISGLLQQAGPQYGSPYGIGGSMPQYAGYPAAQLMPQYPQYPQMPQYPQYPTMPQYPNRPTGISCGPTGGSGGYPGGIGQPGGQQPQLAQLMQLLLSLLGGGNSIGGYPNYQPMNY